MSTTMIGKTILDAENERREAALRQDYESLGERLARRGIDIDAIKRKVAAYGVAVPSWGVGTGGTRFARFPGKGEPRNIFDKLEDCAVIQQLTRATPNVSLHIPWDKVSDLQELKQKGAALGLGFDAMNSNTFSDAPGQAHSYKFGSLSHSRRGHARPSGRAQSRMHRHRPAARLEGTDGLGRRRLQLSRPEQLHQIVRALSRCDESGLCRTARGLARLHRTQDVRAGLLFDRGAGLGHQLPDRPGTRTQGLLPGRPRPPRAERQHRDDRRPADPVQEARWLPLQRFEIWRRRPRYRLDRPLSPVPRLQRTRRCRDAGCQRLRSGPYARPEPQCHRSDRKPDDERDGGLPRLCTGAHRRPHSARQASSRTTTH